VNDTCRGYPEPTITWQREDKQNIVLRDGAGNIHKGEYNLYIHTYCIYWCWLRKTED
jgi:hypothetical protein